MGQWEMKEFVPTLYDALLQSNVFCTPENSFLGHVEGEE